MKTIYIISILFYTLSIVSSQSFLSNILANILANILMPTCQRAKVQFSTVKSSIPSSLEWKQIGFAKEIINQLEKIVVVSGGNKPIPLNNWDNFTPTFPWSKNLDRNLLFQKTAFLRSPGTSVNCNGTSCIKQRNYKGYTWIDLAQTICVEYIPSKTDLLKPAKGYVAIKTIKKCQVVYFENSIYQLTDNKGNFYVVCYSLTNILVSLILYNKYIYLDARI